MTEQPRNNMKTFSSTADIGTVGLAELGRNQPQQWNPETPRLREPKMTFSALLHSAREAKESENTAWILLSILGALVLALSFWI